jgi:CHAD domain-containing protein
VGNNLFMAKRSKLLSTLDEAAHDPTVRAFAASAAVAAGGALAAGKAARNRVAERRRRADSRRYRLAREDTPLAGVTRVARGQLDLATELLSEDGREGSPEAVHDARKALKRLRTLLRIARHFLGDERYRHENVVLRDAGRALSDERDAQVLHDSLDALATGFADEVPAGTWSRFGATLATEAQAAAGSDGSSHQETAAALSEARLRAATWPVPGEGGAESLGPGLERIYRRGRRALRAANRKPTTENLHELRKRAKDLWYGARLLRPVSPKRIKQLAGRAHRLADLLGDDHDLAVLLDRARSRPELFEPGELELLTALIKRRRRVLQRRALRCAARVYRRKPRKLLRTLSLA